MAYLIMNRGADAARETLLDIFWPDTDPEHARASLKTALWSIRRCVITAGADADDFMLASKAIVRWTADTTVDASDFAALASTDDAGANREAQQLYRGDFLEGDYDNWTVAERERLAALYERVLGRIARATKDADAAQRFIARNPYDEEMYATLVESELSAGRRGSAASWVERCRKALAEVGERPSRAFEQRFGDIVHVELAPPAEISLPFAGRESQLGFLAERFNEAREGRGSITLVHGEAGIGKSTLLQRAGGVASDAALRVIAVRCSSDISGSFGPWPQLFTSLTGADFNAFVAEHTADIVTALAVAITARLTAQTVLIVDDAHQLSAEALDILVAVARSSVARHAVIIAVRPEGVAAIRAHLVDVALEELALAPLDRSSLQWALAQALGSDQYDVLDTLYKRSGGHPLFFSGLLNSLVSGGVLTRSHDRWQLIKALDADIELPETVKRFIEIRLQARGDVPRAVACALALEPSASADDLVVVLGMDEPTVFDAIDDLLALGLVVQTESGPALAFSHELIREVAAVGLNSGRRTALHRAYAQRLSGSHDLEASLRRARHLNAIGDFLSAAQCYLNSGREALGSNAPQDALERCDAGIASANRLENSVSREVVADLYNMAARASIACGDASDAVVRAREATRLARLGGDLHEMAQATLSLAMMEGAAYEVSEQRSDAAEAELLAKACGDQALLCHALVQRGSAARELGLRDEAFRACGDARNLALEHGYSEVAQIALEELMRAQITWWLFPEARNSALVGMDAAKRISPLTEAAMFLSRSALWYLSERFTEAQADLHTALRTIAEGACTRASLTLPIHPRPVLQFLCHYMTAKIEVAQQNWNESLAAIDRACALTSVAKLPRQRQALTLVRIDTLLQRGNAGDSEKVRHLITTLPDASNVQGLLGWSDCVELARVRVAIRRRADEGATLLRRALNILEENAHRAPLDCDRAFANLAVAAAEAGEVAVANRARSRSRHYRSLRMAAAGADWGGSHTEGATIERN
jgi:DNA-binding SARP family transcriptional activator